ncbi:MAG: ATP-binding protein [Ferruginibacter sp.]
MKRIGYYVWILSLTVALLLLIMAAQLFTSENINGLKKGNKEAAVTFTINNRLQEMVNSSASLEALLTRQTPGRERLATIRDSLAVIGYNAAILKELHLDDSTKNNFSKLNGLISRQVNLGYRIIDAIDADQPARRKSLADSLLSLKLSDSIYQTAVAVEKGLEKKLQSTLGLNTETSQRLSGLNKGLGLIAIAAILILGTIIINRHLRQVSLIRELELANEEVKKSAQIKEQFLANMSHEIRTPLNAIKGFSRLMLQTPLNEEQRKFADVINNSSNNLLHLVNDILDIAKIEAGKMVVEQKEFDLKRMLQTLEYMFMNAVGEKQLQYYWSVADEVPLHIKGDADRLYQILVNLISNAIKFTAEGFVRLDVTKTGEHAKEVYLQFRVEDTGIGIPAGKQEIIFERFQQVSNTPGVVQKGTGLGLAIVKNLSQLLGGTVAVSSTEGKGTVFTVALPFGKIAETSGNKSDASNEGSQWVQYPGAKVLVAEDNAVNQLLITHMLRAYGINPDICENGADVMKRLETTSYNLVLMDIQMPLMNGYEAALAIRQKNIQVPVVAMTAYVMPGEKEKCIAAGMNAYLAKPLDEEELRAVLQQELSGLSAVPPGKKPAGGPSGFLLELAGGDQQMADLILAEVKKQVPADIEQLEKISQAKNITALPALCHHLVSSVSPLGHGSTALQKIASLRQAVAREDDWEKINFEIRSLQQELQKICDET